jgi:hypothetical protein
MAVFLGACTTVEDVSVTRSKPVDAFLSSDVQARCEFLFSEPELVRALNARADAPQLLDDLALACPGLAVGLLEGASVQGTTAPILVLGRDDGDRDDPGEDRSVARTAENAATGSTGPANAGSGPQNETSGETPGTPDGDNGGEPGEPAGPGGTGPETQNNDPENEGGFDDEL